MTNTKKLLFLLIILMGLLSGIVNAQTIVKDSGGVFVPVRKSVHDSSMWTGQMFKAADGKLYQIFAGAKGGRYILMVSKNGKTYKKYLKIS